jgi:hypothetical protein
MKNNLFDLCGGFNGNVPRKSQGESRGDFWTLQDSVSRKETSLGDVKTCTWRKVGRGVRTAPHHRRIRIGAVGTLRPYDCRGRSRFNVSPF